MATVAAVFDDSVALERAVDALGSAGLGDDIVQVSENRDADTAPERSDTSGDPDTAGGDIGVPAGVGAGGLLGLSGSGGSQGAAPLLGGGLFGGDGLGRLDALGNAAEPFRLAAERGGKLVILETNEVDRAVATLKAAGAQQVYPS